MRLPIGRTIVVLAGAATLAVGGAAYAASGHHAAHSHSGAANARMMAAEPTSPDTDNIQSGDQTTLDAAAQVKSTSKQPSADTDNVQSGDQTALDNGANARSAPTGEQAGESGGGSEVAGNDGPGGHADEPGNPNADHQFQGQE